MSLRLYQIPEVFERLEALLLEAGGELTPEIEAVLAEAQLAGAEKIEAAWAVVKNLQALEKAAKEEGDRLIARSKAAGNSADRLKAAVLPALQAMGGKVKTTRWSIFTVTRPGLSVEIKPGRDFFELPGEWFKVGEPSLRLSVIKDAIEKGAEVPDALVVVPSSSTYVSSR